MQRPPASFDQDDRFQGDPRTFAQARAGSVPRQAGSDGAGVFDLPYPSHRQGSVAPPALLPGLRPMPENPPRCPWVRHVFSAVRTFVIGRDPRTRNKRRTLMLAAGCVVFGSVGSIVVVEQVTRIEVQMLLRPPAEAGGPRISIQMNDVDPEFQRSHMSERLQAERDHWRHMREFHERQIRLEERKFVRSIEDDRLRDISRVR